MLVRDAAVHVPLYRSLFADVDLSKFRGVDDLARLPAVSKADLLAVGEQERRSARYAGESLIRVSTGGTSGEMLGLLLTPAYAQRRTAEAYRVLATNGYRPWDRIAVVMQRPVPQRWYHHLGVLRQSLVPVESPIVDQQSQLAQERPAIIEGYPSRLHLLVDGLDLGYAPKVVLSHSEMLLPHVRARVEAAFGAPVRDVYESWEFGRIAWEFSGSGGLVLAGDSHVIEILDGEVCVTDLNNYSMPLIRYRTGDRARLGDDWANGFQRLDSLEGRVSDYLELPDGTRTPLVVVFHFLIRVPGVAGIQLRRRGRSAVTALVQAGDGYTSRTDAEIRDRLERRFGFGDVVVQRVEKLPRTQSGKMRWLIDDSCEQPEL